MQKKLDNKYVRAKDGDKIYFKEKYYHDYYDNIYIYGTGNVKHQKRNDLQKDIQEQMVRYKDQI